MKQLERWFYRTLGVTILCHRCARFTLRQVCGVCRRFYAERFEAIVKEEMERCGFLTGDKQ